MKKRRAAPGNSGAALLSDAPERYPSVAGRVRLAAQIRGLGRGIHATGLIRGAGGRRGSLAKEEEAEDPHGVRQLDLAVVVRVRGVETGGGGLSEEEEKNRAKVEDEAQAQKV